MDVTLPSHDALRDALLEFGDLKVWSVLVTIFGDLAPKAGAYLPGPFLTAITSDLGIRPEAQRVALHRLRKDGWIEVEKDGRVSRYALSRLARRETEAVQSRVFDARVARPVTASLILPDPGRPGDVPGDWIALGAQGYLSDGAPKMAGALVATVDVAGLPEWVRRRAIPAEIEADYRALAQLLAGGDVPIEDFPEGTRLALRLLILHRWRRLVLSHSRTAANLMGEAWIGNACRDRVHHWLARLPRPTRAEIETP